MEGVQNNPWLLVTEPLGFLGAHPPSNYREPGDYPRYTPPSSLTAFLGLKMMGLGNGDSFLNKAIFDINSLNFWGVLPGFFGS